MTLDEKIAVLTAAKVAGQRVTITLTGGRVIPNLLVFELVKSETSRLEHPDKEMVTTPPLDGVRFSTDDPSLAALGCLVNRIEEITVDVS